MHRSFPSSSPGSFDATRFAVHHARMDDTVATYLLTRLKQAGLKHAFGVPGDYVLTFMDRLIESGIELVGTCNELNAGYAADAYARINGIGCICVTWAWAASAR